MRYYLRPQLLRLYFRKIPVAPSFAKTGFYSEKLPGRLQKCLRNRPRPGPTRRHVPGRHCAAQ